MIGLFGNLEFTTGEGQLYALHGDPTDFIEIESAEADRSAGVRPLPTFDRHWTES
jgi:hypothetical protein